MNHYSLISLALSFSNDLMAFLFSIKTFPFLRISEIPILMKSAKKMIINDPKNIIPKVST